MKFLNIIRRIPASLRMQRRITRSRLGRVARLSFVTMESRLLPAVSIMINYGFDTNNFFDTQAKKDVLQFAANSIASSLNDSLSAIVPSGSNTWTIDFPNPSNGTTQLLSNQTIPANTIVIYVGGSNLGATNEAGEGSTGGLNGRGDQNWINLIKSRGQAGVLLVNPTDYAPWGGAISFDNTGTTNWYFGQAASGISSSQTDFLSVAEHELCHVLGIGTSESWTTRVVGTNFTGASATAANGGQPVPLSSGKDHWAQGTTSNGQPALMDPTLFNGSRVLISPLDYAGLADVGWQVQRVAPTVQFSVSALSVNDKAGTALVAINRTGDLAAFSVNYSTSDGTAIAGTNYTTTNGVLSFGAGETTKTITIPIAPYATKGPNLSFNVGLSAASSGAVIGGISTTTVTIVDSQNPVPGDFTGDGKTDIAVYRPANGNWYINNAAPVSFGWAGFDIPVPGDYNGDGKTDIAVYRPTSGTWFISGQAPVNFGWAGFDIPVPGDFNGDGKTDIAVYRPISGTWYINGQAPVTFGWAGFDNPVPGDYNGDGKTDIAVYRPSSGTWFITGSAPVAFGWAGVDIPIPGDYNGDGKTDVAVYRPNDSTWYSNVTTPLTFGWAGFDLPAPGYYNGDGKSDIAVYRPVNSTWFISGGATASFSGTSADIPLTQPLAMRLGGTLDVNRMRTFQTWKGWSSIRASGSLVSASATRSFMASKLVTAEAMIQPMTTDGTLPPILNGVSFPGSRKGRAGIPSS